MLRTSWLGQDRVVYCQHWIPCFIGTHCKYIIIIFKTRSNWKNSKKNNIKYYKNNLKIKFDLNTIHLYTQVYLYRTIQFMCVVRVLYMCSVHSVNVYSPVNVSSTCVWYSTCLQYNTCVVFTAKYNFNVHYMCTVNTACIEYFLPAVQWLPPCAGRCSRMRPGHQG